MRNFSVDKEVSRTLGPKQRIRGWKFRLLLHLALILGLSLGASGCDKEKILGQFFGLKGYVLEGLGHHQEALEAFNRAIEYDPDQAQAYAGRGLAHFYTNHWDEAIADYDRALSLKPNQASTHLNRGLAYHAKSQFDKALADYNRTIDLDPTGALGYNNRGESYRLKGQLDKAMADYNRALELNPELDVAYNNRGLIYFARGQTDQALAEYNQSIEKDPKYCLPYANRARLYYQTKQYDLAWQDVQKAQSLGGQMDPQFIETLQQVLAGEKKEQGNQPIEKKAPSSRSPKETKAQLYKTLNRVLGYAGLALWGYVLLYFFFWKTLGRRLLKKPIKIPAEFGLERKNEYLAKRRATTQTALKQLERLSKGLGFPIIISCLGLSVMGAFGWMGHQHFSFDSLLLAGVLIPGYFSIFLVKTITRDTLKQLEEGECIVQTRSWSAGKPFWLLNLLPPLALTPLFYQIPWQDLTHRLGFGLGVVLAVIVLSIIFIRAKATVGICVNLILLNFVYLAHYLPGLDKLEKLKGLPFREFLLQFLPVIALPLVAVVSAGFLVSYTLVKKRGVSMSPQFYRLSISRLTLSMAILAPIVGAEAQKHKIMPFSWAFVGAQALAWLAVLISLVVKDYRQKVDFNEIRDYIVNEKGLRVKLGRTTILVYLGSFLAVCTFCESFRGLWFLWAATALWISLILACLWKVWRYAFIEP